MERAHFERNLSLLCAPSTEATKATHSCTQPLHVYHLRQDDKEPAPVRWCSQLQLWRIVGCFCGGGPQTGTPVPNVDKRTNHALSCVRNKRLCVSKSGGAHRSTETQRPFPSDATPTDVTPTDVKPTDVTPTDVRPIDVTPTDVMPIDVTPTDVTPTDVRPTDVRPIDVTPTDETPIDVTPI